MRLAVIWLESMGELLPLMLSFRAENIRGRLSLLSFFLYCELKSSRSSD